MHDSTVPPNTFERDLAVAEFAFGRVVGCADVDAGDEAVGGELVV